MRLDFFSSLLRKCTPTRYMDANGRARALPLPMEERIPTDRRCRLQHQPPFDDGRGPFQSIRSKAPAEVAAMLEMQKRPVASLLAPTYMSQTPQLGTIVVPIRVVDWLGRDLWRGHPVRLQKRKPQSWRPCRGCQIGAFVNPPIYMVKSTWTRGVKPMHGILKPGPMNALVMG